MLILPTSEPASNDLTARNRLWGVFKQNDSNKIYKLTNLNELTVSIIIIMIQKSDCFNLSTNYCTNALRSVTVSPG